MEPESQGDRESESQGDRESGGQEAMETGSQVTKESGSQRAKKPGSQGAGESGSQRARESESQRAREPGSECCDKCQSLPFPVITKASVWGRGLEQEPRSTGIYTGKEIYSPQTHITPYTIVL